MPAYARAAARHVDYYAVAMLRVTLAIRYAFNTMLRCHDFDAMLIHAAIS